MGKNIRNIIIESVRKTIKEDKIPGGLGEGLTIKDLAKKYKTSVKEVNRQLTKGIDVEMEHTTSVEIAGEIAFDHLVEDLYYYDKLKTIEEDADDVDTSPDTAGDTEPAVAISKWESGIERGKGNPLDDITNWESGVSRGAGNPVP